MNPYLIPANAEFTVIHFSGGKTSGFLLWHILEAHGGKLPENACAVFSNTGKEVEPTYTFVRDFERETGQKIHWVEYWNDKTAKGGAKDPKHKHKVVNFDTAARNGEPFAALIRSRQYAPNVKHRICTYELKVETCARFLTRDLGIDTWRDIIGFRHDEPRRWNAAIADGRKGRGKCTANIRDYPLVLAEVTREMVEDFWADVPWGLRMDSNYGNCDLCFMKGRGLLMRLMRQKPELADWWIDMEESAAGKRGQTDTSKTFFKDATYRELKLIATSQQELLPMDVDDSPHLPCFCFD